MIIKSGCPWKIKKLTIKVFGEKNEKYTKYHARPRAGQNFIKPSDIEATLDQFIMMLDTHAARSEYKLVQIAPNAYNFVWVKFREQHFVPPVAEASHA